MNTYSLESFITFCDDMMIAEEGYNIRTAISMVGNVINQIIRFIRSIPSKISEFINKKYKGNTNSKEYKESVEKSKTLIEKINDATDKLTEANKKMKQMQDQNDKNMAQLDQLQNQAELFAKKVINSTNSIDPELQKEIQSDFRSINKVA